MVQVPIPLLGVPPVDLLPPPWFSVCGVVVLGATLLIRIELVFRHRGERLYVLIHDLGRFEKSAEICTTVTKRIALIWRCWVCFLLGTHGFHLTCSFFLLAKGTLLQVVSAGSWTPFALWRGVLLLCLKNASAQCASTLRSLCGSSVAEVL